MSDHLKEIRSGFLRNVGAAPITMLLPLVSKWVFAGIGQPLSNTAVWTIAVAVFALTLVWLVLSYRSVVSAYTRRDASIDRRVRVLVERMENEKGKHPGSAQTTMQHTQEELEAISIDLKNAPES